MSLAHQSYRVGDARITRIPELRIESFTTTGLIPDWRPGPVDSVPDWMVPDCLDASGRHAIIHTHAWLVQTPLHTILVDTAVGNDKPRALPAFDKLQAPFLDHLEQAGVTPGDVDHVLITHLHADHVGWNTRLADGRWQPTFANARYAMPQPELERIERLIAREGETSPKAALFFDSVLPVLEADRVDRISAEGGSILDGLFVFHPTPGHCSGHMSLELSSAGERAWFPGDVMHHPIQVAHPEWSSVFCEDPAQGRLSRVWALNRAADTGNMMFTSHFPASGAGHVRRNRTGFEWSFG